VISSIFGTLVRIVASFSLCNERDTHRYFLFDTFLLASSGREKLIAQGFSEGFASSLCSYEEYEEHIMFTLYSAVP